MGVFRSFIVFAACTVCVVYAQRPFYASSNTYPGVLPQNLPANSNLDNRIGENTTPDPYKAYEKDPVYNVEKVLVDRIKNEYPRDKQPFWYINAAQLNKIRYPEQQIPEQLAFEQQQAQVQQAQVQQAQQQENLQFDLIVEALRRQQAMPLYYYGQ